MSRERLQQLVFHRYPGILGDSRLGDDERSLDDLADDFGTASNPRQDSRTFDGGYGRLRATFGIIGPLSGKARSKLIQPSLYSSFQSSSYGR